MNKITVAIATHNPVKDWLQQTLNSCKGVDAIIIGDDHSDKPVSLEDYRFPVSDVRLLRNDSQLGCFKAFARLLDAVDEGFISPQADDDYFSENFPEIIERLRGSEADVVHFPCQYFGKYGFMFGYCPYPNVRSLYVANNIYGASFLRKELWEFMEGYQLEVAADWDFWVRALKSNARFDFYRKIGAYFRVTERSMFEKQLVKYGRDEINRMVRANVDKWSKGAIR